MALHLSASHGLFQPLHNAFVLYVAFSVLGPRPKILGIARRRRYWESRLPYSTAQKAALFGLPVYKKIKTNAELRKHIMTWPLVHANNVTLLGVFCEDFKRYHDKLDSCELIGDHFETPESILDHSANECRHNEDFSLSAEFDARFNMIHSGIVYRIAHWVYPEVFPPKTLPISAALSTDEQQAMRFIAKKRNLEVSLVEKDPIFDDIEKELLDLRKLPSPEHTPETEGSQGALPRPRSILFEILNFAVIVFIMFNLLELIRGLRRIMTKSPTPVTNLPPPQLTSPLSELTEGSEANTRQSIG
jgi:hypothetical protein